MYKKVRNRRQCRHTTSTISHGIVPDVIFSIAESQRSIPK